MTPILLSEELKAILKIKGGDTIKVHRIPEGTTNKAPNCLNCNDTGIVWVQTLVGPIEQPSSAKTIITYLEGKMYRVIESLVSPCPVCQDHTVHMQYLWEQSGLDPYEYNWKVDYIKGMPGKTIAYQQALDLLASIPNPTGLYLFYGDFGVGKTGLLKALVAQFTVAGMTARYVRASDFLLELRQSYEPLAYQTEGEIIDTYSRYSLLAIDEVDIIKQTAWAEITLRTLLDTRYTRRHSLATLLATNQNPDEMWGYLASRWLDGVRVLVEGKSLRGERRIYTG